MGQQTPADPTQWRLPADAAELIGRRSRHTREFRLPDGHGVAVIGQDLHYQDDDGQWQPVALDWQDSSDAGYADALDQVRYRVRHAGDGTRRIYPRRDRLDEWIEFAPLQALVGGTWQNISWSSRSREGRTLTLERANATLQVVAGPGRLKIDLTLKDSSAARPLRWPVSLHGLSRQGWTLVSDHDGTVVCQIDPLSLIDAAGTKRDVAVSIQDGAVQFTADVSGLTYPVVVDPSTTFDVAASGDDGTAGDTSLPGTSTTDTTLSAEMSKGPFGTNYRGNALIRFDTSSLAGKTLTDAVLSVYPTTMQNDSGRNYIGEYYDSANWPISSADYSASVGTTAFSVGASTMTTGSYHDLTLSNLGSISTSGMTGFRISISGSAPANGNLNKVYVASFDNGSNAPRLTVTYTEPPVDKSASDSGSVSLGEAASLQAQLGGSEATALTATEAGSLQAQLAGSDSGTFSLSAEAGSVTITETRAASDDATLSLAETAQRAIAMQSLRDDFENGVIDAGHWVTTEPAGTALTETGGRLRATIDAGTVAYAKLATVEGYALENDALTVWVPSVSGQAEGAETLLTFANADGSNSIDLLLGAAGSGSLLVRSRVAWSDSWSSGISYDPAQHRLWRLREAAGTTYAEVSADGFAWVELWSFATPWDVSFGYVSLSVGSWQALAADYVVEVDNVNIDTRFPDLSQDAALDLAEQATLTAELAAEDAATLALDEAAALDLAGSEAAALDLSQTAELLAQDSRSDGGTVGISEASQLVVVAADSPTIALAEEAVQIDVEAAAFGFRLRVDVFAPDGSLLGSGPLVDVIEASYTLHQDEIGEFALALPATTERAALITDGVRLDVYREAEGLVYRAIVESAQTVVDASGSAMLSVRGWSRSRELLFANTLLGRAYAGSALTAAAADLLAGTGWTTGTIGTTTNLVNARFEGVSVWNALARLAETYGWHVVEDNLGSTVDLASAGGASGLVLRNLPQVGGHPLAVVPITRLTIVEAQPELWNVVIPVGGGEGVSRLTLQYATRSSPYSVQSATGPDGQTYWYVEDAASVAAHGTRTKVLSVKDAVPLANSPSEVAAAADALYDVAAAWLGWHAQPQETYAVEVVGLKHVVDGAVQLRPGQTVRLQYRGLAESTDGTLRVWKDVDADLFVLGMERHFAADGADRWTLTVSTVDAAQPDDAGTIAKAIEQLWAVQTALKPFTFTDTFGPLRDSVDSSHPLPLVVALDANVNQLHQAKLTVKMRPVRANAAGAASGGGATSSGGTSHSHSVSGQTAQSGGGATSSGGSSHSHTVSGLSSIDEPNPLHKHQVVQAQPTSAWADPSNMQQLIFTDVSGTAFGVLVGRGSSDASTHYMYTSGGFTHRHDVSSTTSAAESSHTHSVPSHTHSVSSSTSSSDTAHTHSVPAHTHALSYGIHEGPAPSAPQVTVTINGTDRTAALGGPWDDDVTLDLTPYLVDAGGHPLQQQNTLSFGSDELIDLEVQVKTIQTMYALVPV